MNIKCQVEIIGEGRGNEIELENIGQANNHDYSSSQQKGNKSTDINNIKRGGRKMSGSFELEERKVSLRSI
jgi:hypothetical protein